MPAPESALVVQRSDLADAFYEFDYSMQNYIGYQVMPVMEVARQSGQFARLPVEQMLKMRTTDRAPGAGYERHEWTFVTDTYNTKEHGTEEPIDDRESEMYAEFFDAEVVSTARAFDAIMRNAENRIAAALYASLGSTTAASGKWDVYGTATPDKDIFAVKQVIYAQCGMWPNTLIVSRFTFEDLKFNDSIINKLKAQNFQDVRPGSVSIGQMAVALNVDQVLVADSTKDTALEGQASVFAPIWDKTKAILCKTATGPDIREPCIGRTMHWSADGSQIGGLVESYEDPRIRGNVVRVRHDVDEKILYPECGRVIGTVR